jgi:hypothetical protein
MVKIKSTIERYIQNNKQEYQRYNSWNHCYLAFVNNSLEDDILALNLGFYLASWGMYRGSSGLLQKDYKIHVGAVEILKHYDSLRCSKEKDVTHSSIPKILECTTRLQNHYTEFEFETLKGKKKHISPTDTLISKVLLGTLGCVPAFDRFFIDGVNQTLEKKEQFKSLKKPSLEKLFAFVDGNKELLEIQNRHPNYPKMKLVDMYFWQVGFENYAPKKK